MHDQRCEQHADQSAGRNHRCIQARYTNENRNSQYQLLTRNVQLRARIQHQGRMIPAAFSHQKSQSLHTTIQPWICIAQAMAHCGLLVQLALAGCSKFLPWLAVVSARP